MTTATALRRLYLTRFSLALAWAALTALAPDPVDPLPTVLLVAYPLIDAAGVLTEMRVATPGTSRVTGAVNVAVSLVAALALGIAAQDSAAAVLVTWGAWAVASGLTQLLSGWGRRALGGQWPLIASGGLSTAVGLGFEAQGAGDDPQLGSIAGYAVAGGVFFLVAAVRVGSKVDSLDRVVGAEGIEPPTASL